MTDPLTDAEITRYARQLILPEIGDEGQDAIKATKLGIIGAGGLGNPALMLSAAGGFGTITVIDDDVIEPTNFNRQFLFTPQDEGQGKATNAAAKVQAQNPHICVKGMKATFDEASADAFVSAHDIIIDASDNLETRLCANRMALRHNKPLIFVSAIRFEGQLAVFAPPATTADARTACYECLFPYNPNAGNPNAGNPNAGNPNAGLLPNCATVGIAGPITTMMGAMAVLEAVKLVTKAGEAGQTLHGRLMLFDGLSYHMDMIKTKRDNHCPACSHLS